MTRSDLHEIVETLPDSSVDGATVLLRALSEGRLDPDQAWFWTPEWLSGELEADREARSDPGPIFENLEQFRSAMRGLRS